MKEIILLDEKNKISNFDKTKSYFICEIEPTNIIGVIRFYDYEWKYDWWIRRENNGIIFALYMNKFNPLPGGVYKDKEFVINIVKEHYPECFEWLLFHPEWLGS